MLLLFGMVDIETVLVLGAGASKAFGFPTGEELVKRICLLLSQEQYFDIYYQTAGQYSPEMAEQFPNVLKRANPLSVDAWLEHNPKYIEVGKVAIVIALLGYEKESDLYPQNNWYQLLFKRLDGPFEEFQNNKLSIITFNYDRSLEQYLFETFRYTHTEKNEKECKEKLNQLRIVHVYGSMGRLEGQFESAKHLLPIVSYGNKLDRNRIILAAKSIHIIPRKQPQGLLDVVQTSISDGFKEAQKLIAGADALYFLGFGYNQTNMERLGIETLQKTLKNMGTAKDLGYQEFQEIARMHIFRKLARTYSGQTLQTKTVDNKIENFLFDKTVYEFLHGHVDFNSL